MANGCKKLYILNENRFITPNEAKQIQGIPVRYKLCDKDNKEFKMIGNSMSVNLLVELFKQIFNHTKLINLNF